MDRQDSKEAIQKLLIALAAPVLSDRIDMGAVAEFMIGILVDKKKEVTWEELDKCFVKPCKDGVAIYNDN